MQSTGIRFNPISGGISPKGAAVDVNSQARIKIADLNNALDNIMTMQGKGSPKTIVY